MRLRIFFGNAIGVTISERELNTESAATYASRRRFFDFAAPLSFRNSEAVLGCKPCRSEHQSPVLLGSPRRGAFRRQRGEPKIWRMRIGALGYCKSLKSHKTAKELFGKIWRKKGWFWKFLAKRFAGSGRGPEPRPGRVP
jgi:hypothetical protein